MGDGQDVGCTQHSVRADTGSQGIEDDGEVHLQMDETCSLGSQRLEF